MYIFERIIEQHETVTITICLMDKNSLCCSSDGVEKNEECCDPSQAI